MSRLQHPDAMSYLAALRFRGGKTIIVEGPTDKLALSRALHEFESDRRLTPGTVVVDSVDSVGGMGASGNRERVEVLHATARAAGHDTYALVDREFRGFVATAIELRDDLGTHAEPGNFVVWTRGHSIENYFFESEFFQGFVRYRFCDRVNSGAVDALGAYWPEIVIQSAAYTVAVRDLGCLARLSKALTVDAWEINGSSSIELAPAQIEKAALGRAMPALEAQRLASQYRDLLTPARMCSDASLCRWLAHGHLGDEAIWTAVGRVLRHMGVDAATVREVAHGHQESKALYRADAWAQRHRRGQSVFTPEPLWRAVGVSQT